MNPLGKPRHERIMSLIYWVVPVAVGIVLGAVGGSSPTPADARPDRSVAQQLIHERAQWHAERGRLVRILRQRPDFVVSLQLAGIAYGQDWRALERCALSEGYRRAERHDRHNARTNDASGSLGPLQFIRSTWLTTPYARLDWTRQDVQAHAAAWMWRAGRRGEWAGRGC